MNNIELSQGVVVDRGLANVRRKLRKQAVIIRTSSATDALGTIAPAASSTVPEMPAD